MILLVVVALALLPFAAWAVVARRRGLLRQTHLSNAFHREQATRRQTGANLRETPYSGGSTWSGEG